MLGFHKGFEDTCIDTRSERTILLKNVSKSKTMKYFQRKSRKQQGVLLYNYQFGILHKSMYLFQSSLSVSILPPAIEISVEDWGRGFLKFVSKENTTL